MKKHVLFSKALERALMKLTRSLPRAFSIHLAHSTKSIAPQCRTKRMRHVNSGSITSKKSSLRCRDRSFWVHGPERWMGKPGQPEPGLLSTLVHLVMALLLWLWMRRSGT